jgi:hypothetical protein
VNGSGSASKVDFRLRPAKAIERKMIAEALQRLAGLADFKDDYQYVGMGSVYFSDFILFHKVLGIGTRDRTMWSIERNSGVQERFELNRPFQCVELVKGDTSDTLPTIDLSVKTLLWLDYDGPLDRHMLSDIALFAGDAADGSVLLVTVNAHKASASEREENLDQGGRASLVSILEKRLGRDRIPRGLNDRDLAGEGLSETYRMMILNEVNHALRDRNAAGASPVDFHQLFNFRYADDAQMLTIGGMLVTKELQSQLIRRGLETLRQYRPGEKPLAIHVPKLTPAEIKFLNAQLPRPRYARFSLRGIPGERAKQYEEIYRYFPNYFEIEF